MTSFGITLMVAKEAEKAYSITKANDGYVVVGDIQLPNSATDAWVLKVDPAETYCGTNLSAEKTLIQLPTLQPQRMAATWLLVLLSLLALETGISGCSKLAIQARFCGVALRADKGFQEAYTVIETGNNDLCHGRLD